MWAVLPLSRSKYDVCSHCRNSSFLQVSPDRRHAMSLVRVCCGRVGYDIPPARYQTWVVY
ncbi:hypothetical protein E2C01_096451 [Portunus trituberculatus]|uniref:Uncharacterized protein n=1 Tax=Portunus trituberculatus TaxID=210409 RepID=A0A5B7K896_PORTR|nr:hypothetical protein [Portunus trituberculatus]